jgi:hypothetical protein
MGIFYRKRTKGGWNMTASSNGFRISKTIKIGGMSFNIGRYIGGKMDGKATGRVTATNGNFGYRKDFTLNKQSKTTKPSGYSSYTTSNTNTDPLPSLSKTFNTDFEPHDYGVSRFTQSEPKRLGETAAFIAELIVSLLPFIAAILWFNINSSFENSGVTGSSFALVVIFTSILYFCSYIPVVLYEQTYGTMKHCGGLLGNIISIAILGLFSIFVLIMFIGSFVKLVS